MIISESDGVFEFKPPEFGFGDILIEPWQLLLLMLAIIAVIAITVIIISGVRSGKGEKFSFTTRDLTYGAVCLAMSFVLSFIGFSLFQGGTITFASILPVSLYCYYFGYRKGAIVTCAFMLLQFLQNPYIVSIWSALLDYVIPYFALSLAGAFSWMNRKVKKENGNKKFAVLAHPGYFIGMLLYVILRYFSHVASGILFYAEWAPAELGPVLYSFAYNSFCIADFAIAMGGAIGLLSSKNFNLLMSTTARSNSRSVQRANAGVAAESDRLGDSDTSAKNHK